MPHNEFLSDSLWGRISADRATSHRCDAAVAYVTSATHILFRKGDTLVVNASDSAITTGQTSAQLLQTLLQRGVDLYCLPSLHAKVYAFGDIVFVGSCNLSDNSRTRLLEAAIRTDDPAISHAALDFLKQLRQSAYKINEAFISRILALPVDPRHEPVNEEINSSARCVLWRLEKPPEPTRSPNMRAYFVALIKAQLGELQPGRPFHLWKGNFGHKSRMSKMPDGRYVLLPDGVTYFSQDKKGAPHPELLATFLLAITTGNSDVLPPSLTHRTLIRFIEE